MRRLFLAALIAMTAVTLPRSATAGDGSAGSVIYILDCSANMGEALAESSPVREASTGSPQSRLTAAKAMLHKLVADAVRNDYKVGVMLYGHRLMWTDDSDTPGVAEQTEYFATTGNFDALRNLIPSSDVEHIHALKRMEARDMLAMSHRLEAVQPWGERPLYLAVVSAAAEMETQSLGESKSIVVLTSGSNQQRLANRETTLVDVQTALERRRITVSFINFGGRDDVAAQTSLMSIAQMTRGKVAPAMADESELSFASLVLDTMTDENTPANGAASMVSTTTLPTPRDQLLEGIVLYYGKPVAKATIQLQTSSSGEIETDRQGRFKFSRVTPGTYKLAVKAIAKNKIREKTIDIVVEDRPQREAFITVDVK